jgi:transposase-like protein
MARLSNQQRAIAIGLLQTDTPVKQVARTMNVSPNAIRKLRTKFQQTDEVKDLPRSGRPKVTTPAQDRLMVNLALRSRTSTGKNVNLFTIKINTLQV